MAPSPVALKALDGVTTVCLSIFLLLYCMYSSRPTSTGTKKPADFILPPFGRPGKIPALHRQCLCHLLHTVPYGHTCCMGCLIAHSCCAVNEYKESHSHSHSPRLPHRRRRHRISSTDTDKTSPCSLSLTLSSRGHWHPHSTQLSKKGTVYG